MNPIRVLALEDSHAAFDLYQNFPDCLGEDILVTPGNDLDAGVLVKRAIESGSPFDVLLMDVNFSISGRRIEKVLADIRQVYEANSVATRPSIVVHSAIGQGNHLAQSLAASSGFDIVTFIAKPAQLDEKRAAILRCVAESAVAATKLSDSESLAQNEATLGDVLTAFKGMEVRDLAQFRSAAAQLHRACLALPPEEMLRPYRHRVDATGAKASAAFADAVGASLQGRLAFTPARVALLRHQHYQQPIIYVTAEGGAEAIELLPLVQGAIVIGERAAHFRQVAGGMGKSCLMINDDLAENRGFWLEDDAIALNDGHTCLRDGDFVTLDTNRGILYAGKQPIAQANMPELYREFVAYAKTVLARQPAQEIDLSAQVDFPEDAQRPAPIVGLSRVENYYLDEAGREVLLSAVLNPSPDNLAQVKLHTADYVDGLINGAQTEITFRLMDFKPDQVAADPATATQLQQRHGTELRGFALAHRLPALYVAQVKGILQALSAKQRMGQKAAIFAIPHAETLADIDCARRIVAHAYNAGFGGFNAIRSSLAVTIETAAGVRNVRQLAEAVATTQDGRKRTTILVGSTDLTENLIGVARQDDRGIQAWVRQQQACGSPFRTMHPALADALRQIAAVREDTSVHDVRIRVCGEHATNPTFVAACHDLGIGVCVPNRPVWTEGLRHAALVRYLQQALRTECALT